LALISDLTRYHVELELELELIQAHVTQKPLLWVEAGAHAVRQRPNWYVPHKT
jgi:hypothetical protein